MIAGALFQICCFRLILLPLPSAPVTSPLAARSRARWMAASQSSIDQAERSEEAGGWMASEGGTEEFIELR